MRSGSASVVCASVCECEWVQCALVRFSLTSVIATLTADQSPWYVKLHVRNIKKNRQTLIVMCMQRFRTRRLCCGVVRCVGVSVQVGEQVSVH